MYRCAWVEAIGLEKISSWGTQLTVEAVVRWVNALKVISREAGTNTGKGIVVLTIISIAIHVLDVHGARRVATPRIESLALVMGHRHLNHPKFELAHERPVATTFATPLLLGSRGLRTLGSVLGSIGTLPRRLEPEVSASEMGGGVVVSAVKFLSRAVLAVAERFGGDLTVRNACKTWIPTNPLLDRGLVLGFKVTTEFMLAPETIWVLVALGASHLRVLGALILGLGDDGFPILAFCSSGLLDLFLRNLTTRWLGFEMTGLGSIVVLAAEGFLGAVL